MKQTVRDYVNLLAIKYPYWNRRSGFDHSMLACHDWGPELSKSVPELFKNSIRALCNVNTSQGFQPWKDVSIPENNLRGGDMTGMHGGPAPLERPRGRSPRPHQAYSSRPSGEQRSRLSSSQVPTRKHLISLNDGQSKHCICPSGYDVASPRMVEALYIGRIPVLIKDHYVPPFPIRRLPEQEVLCGDLD